MSNEFIQSRTEESQSLPQSSNQSRPNSPENLGSRVRATQPEDTRRRDSKSRNWMWTLNNPTDDERAFFSSLTGPCRGISYIVFQEEEAPTTHTRHFQGYLETTQNIKMSWLKNNFNPRAHYDFRRGTQEEAIAYCTKEETRVPDGLRKELGQKRGGAAETKEAKKRERIEWLDAIRSGKRRYIDAPSEILLNTGFNQAARDVNKTMLGPYRPDLEIITIVGSTGIGKSFAAYQIGGCDIVTYSGGQWFGNAHTEGDVLLFDEFTGNIPLNQFLKYLDPYPNQLPVKGGFYPLRATKIFITTNVMPEHWWTKKDDEINEKRDGNLDALYRRIGYPGPGNEHPEYDNGHFIYIPDEKENGEKYSKIEKRQMLKQRLIMLGFDQLNQ